MEAYLNDIDSLPSTQSEMGFSVELNSDYQLHSYPFYLQNCPKMTRTQAM